MRKLTISIDQIQQEQTVFVDGTPLSKARVAVVMLHGRGATAADILSLKTELVPEGIAYMAPQAKGNSWYPHSFLAPLASNEPALSNSLAVIGGVLSYLRQQGISSARVMLLGFSQGACLCLEYAARHARRYAGIVGLSGGLIGPEETLRDYAGSLEGSPVFLGCSTTDFHIPKQRVDDTQVLLTQLGAQVTERLYPDMGHAINDDEISFVRSMIQAAVTQPLNL
ncbi:MAG TPA: dienelactone hydrolase family protein [Terriglobia bacterium]|nr:dienelactone hydrolase family protein [Terriglobia bacterium]